LPYILGERREKINTVDPVFFQTYDRILGADNVEDIAHWMIFPPYKNKKSADNSQELLFLSFPA